MQGTKRLYLILALTASVCSAQSAPPTAQPPSSRSNIAWDAGEVLTRYIDDGAQSMGRSRFTSCPPVPGVARSSRPQAGAHCDHVREGSTRIGTLQAAQVNA